MKNSVYRLLVTLSMVLLIPSMHSCIKDDLTDCIIEPSDNTKLTLQISFLEEETPPIARAAGVEPGNQDGAFNERAINTINLFFYQNGVLKWKVDKDEITYDSKLNKITVPISEGKKELFRDNTNITYDVYMVANNTANLSSIEEGVDNLSDLKNLVFQTSEFSTKGGRTPQTRFVMDGLKSQIINLNDPDLGEIHLRRVASKIRLRLMAVDVPGFTMEGNPRVRLVHFADKSALLTGGSLPKMGATDWQTTELNELIADAPTEVGGGKTTAAPFYAYANNWQNDISRETFLELVVPLKDNNDESPGVASYRYHVPLTPQNLIGEDAEFMNRLDRNYLYDIAVTVKILGGLKEEPVTITGKYTIKEWTTQEVPVDVKGAHYLVVSEQNLIMPNIDTYTLTFNSSISNVTLVDGSLKATYTYVSADGSEPITKPVTDDQRPLVDVQANVASGTISINSPIPVNYIPKDIEFQVTNGQLTETIKIRQLPATYFTTSKGKESYVPGEGKRTSLPRGNSNPYMYGITTLAPGGDDIIWGFPPLDSKGHTINSEEVSKMISPKFEMASQFGASYTKSYADAQAQCNNYTETADDGTVKKGWRLPTAAEIHYIDMIQQTAPMGFVMKGGYYWSNWSWYPTKELVIHIHRQNYDVSFNATDIYGAYRMGKDIDGDNPDNFINKYNLIDYSRKGLYIISNYNEAHVRCVRDIKD